MFATPSRWAISRKSLGALLYFWVECPGDDKRNWKSQRDCCDENLHHPRWRFEGREQDRRCLNQEPGDNRIGHRNLVNVTPLQLGKEVCGIHFAFSSQSF